MVSAEVCVNMSHAPDNELGVLLNPKFLDIRPKPDLWVCGPLGFSYVFSIKTIYLTWYRSPVISKCAYSTSTMEMAPIAPLARESHYPLPKAIPPEPSSNKVSLLLFRYTFCHFL